MTTKEKELSKHPAADGQADPEPTATPADPAADGKPAADDKPSEYGDDLDKWPGFGK